MIGRRLSSCLKLKTNESITRFFSPARQNLCCAHLLCSLLSHFLAQMLGIRNKNVSNCAVSVVRHGVSSGVSFNPASAQSKPFCRARLIPELLQCCPGDIVVPLITLSKISAADEMSYCPESTHMILFFAVEMTFDETAMTNDMLLFVFSQTQNT